MKPCSRCGFLNPDKADYCIKCRFSFDASAAVSQPAAGGKPAGPEPDEGPPDLSKPLDVGAPGARAKPDLIPPPDRDDPFAGKSLWDAGGYQIGGTVSSDRAPSGPPPSDAHALMTGGGALTGVDARPPRGARARKPKKMKAPRGRKKGTGLPPPAGEPFIPGSPIAPGELPPLDGGLPPPLDTGPLPPGPPPGAMPPGRVGRARPGRPPRGAGARGAPRAKPRPAVRKPDLEVLSRIKAVPSRYVMTAVVALLLIFAIAFFAAGRGYFARPGQDILNASAAAMKSAGSAHLAAEQAVDSEEKGAVSGIVSCDISGKNFHAAYSLNVPGVPQNKEIVRSGGKTFATQWNGSWAAEDKEYGFIDFVPSDVFNDSSGVKLLDNQTVENALCYHLKFSGGESLASSLFPDAELGANARTYVEVWIDTAHSYVKRFVLDGSGFEQKGLGRFRCHVEGGYSNWGAQYQINPPI